MWKYVFDKENLKTNGLIIVLVLILIGFYKILTNHFEHTNQVQSKTNEALLQQAVTNEKVAGAVDNLSKVIEKKIR